MVDKRQLLISGQHRRWQRIWQYLFGGWGIVLIAVMVAGGLIHTRLLWTPITAVNMADVMQNQLKMTNPSFAGIDENGNPFSVHADEAHQEYTSPNIIFLTNIIAKMVHIDDETHEKINDNIWADNGEYDKVKRIITLRGNVRMDSSDGNKIRTKEMVIKL